MNTALYEKMAAEQDQYRDWLKSQPPEEILNHAYEYSAREDIVMVMEELELTDAQAQALLESPSPLSDVYHYFEKMETGHMEVIRDSIEHQARELETQRVALMEQAKNLIYNFCQSEYDSPASYDNMKKIGIGYTTITDDEIPIQVNVDLVNLRMDRYLDGRLLDRIQYDSLQQMVTDALENLDFQDLIYVPEETLEAVLCTQEKQPIGQDVPLYLPSAVYASEHGEIALYDRSYQASLDCKEAIEQAIGSHYKDNRLDTAAAVQEVMEKFGPERVNFILANTIRHKEADGRLSRDNKAWAKTIPMPEDSETSHRCSYLVVDQVNPGLVDLFARQARKTVQEKEKESVLQKLKLVPPAHKPVASKKREPER